jgi:predicted PurR-regulated permease PerM
MTRKYWLDLAPGLLIGAGITAATLVAARATGTWALAGPLLLAFAVVGADIVQSRLRARVPRPSAAALIFAVAFPLAGWIVMSSDPTVVRSLVPLMGAASWVALLRPQSQRTRCST